MRGEVDADGRGRLAGRHIAVVEPNSSGHRLVYVRIISETLLDLGARVTVALGRSSAGTEELQRHLDPIADRLDVTFLDDETTSRELLLPALAPAPDLVVLPEADSHGFHLAFGRRRSTRPPVSALVTRDPRWERPAPLGRRAKGAVKLACFTIAQRRRGIHVTWLREPTYEPKRFERGAVDPFITHCTAQELSRMAEAIRAEARLDDDVFWFLVPGVISPRKNVPLILDALRRLTTQETDPVGLALVGPMQDPALAGRDAEDLGREHGVPVRVLDRVLDNDEVNAAILATDAVVMAYSSHSPNSTLGKAHVLGRRLVAAGPPSVRAFVDDLGFGPSVPLDAERLAGAMSAALHADDPEPHPDVMTPEAFVRALLPPGDG